MSFQIYEDAILQEVISQGVPPECPHNNKKRITIILRYNELPRNNLPSTTEDCEIIVEACMIKI